MSCACVRARQLTESAGRSDAPSGTDAVRDVTRFDDQGDSGAFTHRLLRIRTELMIVRRRTSGKNLIDTTMILNVP